MAFEVRALEDGIRFDVKVVPRSSRERIGPPVGDRLKVQLMAPPVDGAANEALVKLLAKRRYAVVIALHSRGGFVDYDGPGAKALATRMARAASVPVLRLASLRSGL